MGNKRKISKPRYEVKFSADRAVKLYKAGKNVSQIASTFGYPKGHGNNRVANALVAAGVYKGTRATA